MAQSIKKTNGKSERYKEPALMVADFFFFEMRYIVSTYSRKDKDDTAHKLSINPSLVAWSFDFC